MLIVPLISALLSLVFAVMVFKQFRAKAKPHQLVWGFGFTFYFFATLSEFLFDLKGPNTILVRTWYLFGATLVPAYLGMGTLYLLAPRKIAHAVMALLFVGTVTMAIVVMTAHVDLSSFAPGDTLKAEGVLADSARKSFYFSAPGAIILIGGAAYSAFVVWLKKTMPMRAVSNILIAIGGWFPVIGGGMERVFSNPDMLYLTELLGIIIIFAGFLVGSQVFANVRIPLLSPKPETLS